MGASGRCPDPCLALGTAHPADAAAVVVFGMAAVTLCLRQRNPRVPFIAVVGLIILTAVSAGAMLVAFDSNP